jgi:capsid assembly protease
MANLHVQGRPWAVTGELAEMARQMIEAGGFTALRLGVAIHAEVHQAARTGGPEKVSGNIALIPILGLITHRGGDVNSMETASAMALEEAVRSAAAEKGISAILLEIDSPGGEVNGIPELAAVIRQARTAKPVVAMANSEAGSAAYWLASQADELIVTPSGRVGSIGVYVAHQDRSQEMAAAGKKITYIHAGKFKIEGNPHEPLADEARTAIQAEVNRYYQMFTADVARGRRVGVDVVRDGFGEGRMIGAAAAVGQGMADAVGTLADAVRRARALVNERGQRASGMAQVEAMKLRRARG